MDDEYIVYKIEFAHSYFGVRIWMSNDKGEAFDLMLSIADAEKFVKEMQNRIEKAKKLREEKENGIGE